MSVIDRCKALREEIAKRNTLVREAKEAETFSERTREIQALREELSQSIGQIRILREHRLITTSPRDHSAVSERLKIYLQQLAQDAAHSGNEHGRAKRSLDALRKSLTETAKEALEAVRRAVPTVEETFLKQVELNPAYKEKVAAIRTARDELRRVSQSVVTDEDLTMFLEKRKELGTLAEDLRPEDFPKEVLEFFKAARHHDGAPLEKLTETVRHWLVQRNQLSHIRVIVAEP